MINGTYIGTGDYTTLLQAEGVKHIVMGITFCNSHAASGEFVDLHAVTSGDVAGGHNLLFKNLFLPPEETYNMHQRIVLGNEEKIVAKTAGSVHSNTIINAVTTYTKLDGLG
ncbi:hypothetical protein CL634_02425 [bacterium]|nr:hypothetical protein [bacterium]|tara:strand:- start:48 stop:383 length:336 start_codon:yes stop_codon:yes gene_type:complete